MTRACTSHRADLIVLGLISAGLIVILLAILAGLFLAKSSTSLPNWAENVLVAIATTAGLKLGDCLAALISLATGRQVEGMSQQLASSAPIKPRPAPPPPEVAEAAQGVADAAQDRADAIGGLPEVEFGGDKP